MGRKIFKMISSILRESVFAKLFSCGMRSPDRTPKYTIVDVPSSHLHGFFYQLDQHSPKTPLSHFPRLFRSVEVDQESIDPSVHKRDA